MTVGVRDVDVGVLVVVVAAALPSPLSDETSTLPLPLASGAPATSTSPASSTHAAHATSSARRRRGRRPWAATMSLTRFCYVRFLPVYVGLTTGCRRPVGLSTRWVASYPRGVKTGGVATCFLRPFVHRLTRRRPSDRVRGRQRARIRAVCSRRERFPGDAVAR